MAYSIKKYQLCLILCYKVIVQTMACLCVCVCHAHFLNFSCSFFDLDSSKNLLCVVPK